MAGFHFFFPRVGKYLELPVDPTQYTHLRVRVDASIDLRGPQGITFRSAFLAWCKTGLIGRSSLLFPLT
jgi:hypothetical protein